MPGALDRQIQAYHRYRPQMLEENKRGWALIAGEKLIGVFEDFEEAALHADEHFPGEQVLIRHISEHRATVPFIVAKR